MGKLFSISSIDFVISINDNDVMLKINNSYLSKSISIASDISHQLYDDSTVLHSYMLYRGI